MYLHMSSGGTFLPGYRQDGIKGVMLTSPESANLYDPSIYALTKGRTKSDAASSHRGLLRVPDTGPALMFTIEWTYKSGSIIDPPSSLGHIIYEAAYSMSYSTVTDIQR